MQKYRLKVSLMGFPIKELYRIIEISGNCTFDDLHEKIFTAFDRYDPHMYTFFLTRQNTESMQKIMNSQEITNPYNIDSNFDKEKRCTAKTTIQDAKLAEKDILHYWFDFGDNWWHRIRVEKISETKDRHRIARIIKKVGESPEQYPDYDEDDFMMMNSQ